MGKSNKKSIIPSRPNPPTAALPFAKAQATAQQTATLLGKIPPEWNADLVKTLGDTLSADQKVKLAVFMEQFAEWGNCLQIGTKALAGAEVQLTERQKVAEADIVHARAGLECEREQGKQAIEAERQALDVQVEKINEQERQAQDMLHDAQRRVEQAASQVNDLARQRQALVEREKIVVLHEAELRNGLVMEREVSLKTLREQVANLEAQRGRVVIETDVERQRLLEQACQDADQIRTEAQALAEDLRKRLAELENRLNEQARREERLHLGEELLRANHKSFDAHVQDAIKAERAALQGKLEKLTDKLEAKSEEIDRLQAELDDLDDLRQAGGDDPGQLLEELDRLRQDNRVKDRELADLRNRAELDDPAELRAQRDALQAKLDKQQGELARLHAHESDWQRSVTERQDWERTRAVMETGRTLLYKESERLRLQVDDLLSRQQSAAVFPALKAMDADEKLQLRTHTDDISPLKSLVNDLQARLYHAVPGKQLFFQEDVLQLFLGGLAMSQLHVFQGISGTGKTSLATAFAAAVGAEITTVAVQAGWRDRADLLGYYNAFEKRFYERSTLQALYRAQTEADKDKLHIVLLDEMNLSRPEQYFADFLSALEMDDAHRWINLMDSVGGSDMPQLLRNGRDIKVPRNVWFIGTANQDETTHAFADKTHDRAFVLDLPRLVSTDVKLARPNAKVTWSFDSLSEQFDQTCKKFNPQVEDLMAFINQSALTQTLADDFQLGWGNRLERQLKRFVPVVIEAGGSEALAVDHLLQSRMFRDGKVVGRHDVQTDVLKRIEDQLQELWSKRKLDGEPTQCLAALQRDIKRLERGG